MNSGNFVQTLTALAGIALLTVAACYAVDALTTKNPKARTKDVRLAARDARMGFSLL